MWGMWGRIARIRLFDAPGRGDSEITGQAHEVGDRVRLHLRGHLMPVNLGRALRDPTVEANLLLSCLLITCTVASLVLVQLSSCSVWPRRVSGIPPTSPKGRYSSAPFHVYSACVSVKCADRPWRSVTVASEGVIRFTTRSQRHVRRRELPSPAGLSLRPVRRPTAPGYRCEGSSRARPVTYTGDVSYHRDAWSAYTEYSNGLGGTNFRAGAEYRFGAVELRTAGRYSQRQVVPVSRRGIRPDAELRDRRRPLRHSDVLEARPHVGLAISLRFDKR
jgi:hypothetical protein